MFPINTRVIAKQRIVNNGGVGDLNQKNQTASDFVCAELGDDGIVQLDDSAEMVPASTRSARYLVHFNRTGALVPVDPSEVTTWINYGDTLAALSFGSNSVAVQKVTGLGWHVSSTVPAEDYDGSDTSSHIARNGRTHFATKEEAQREAEMVVLGEVHVAEEIRIEHERRQAESIKQETAAQLRAQIENEKLRQELLAEQIKTAKLEKELKELKS